MGEMKHIDGVVLAPLKIIPHQKGDIFHVLKSTDPEFYEFGEAYFSSVNFQVIKAWKKHFKMRLNLVVPVGEVKFVLFDDRMNSTTKGQINEFLLSKENYFRLTIPPEIWFGFQGLSDGLNLILNIANINHDPTEQINSEGEDIPYNWI